MGGLVLDVYIEYLLRIIIRAIRLFRSRKWPVSKATVMSAIFEMHHCDLAMIYYQYFINGENHADVYVKPFILSGSAKYYAGDLERGDALNVRTNPGDPSISVLEEPGPRHRSRA